MCGIAGAVWNRQDRKVTSATLARMTAALTHRGPDDDGTWFSKERGSGANCALGFRRLSIIDLAGGHQPLSNEDGSVWVVFNGEIYNYRELREMLVQRGHTFQTSSDTETLVHLYEDFQLDFVQHLRGMFAIALWDDKRQRLVLVRDRLGKKPVVYRHEAGRLAFASELKSLLQIPDLPREVDPRAIDEFLTYSYVPHPRSILRGFEKLPPAHLGVYENDQLTVTRYWTPPYEPDATSEQMSELPATAWKRSLRETLTESVRLRMRSDVPLGAFLSGGVDSTVIAGLMQSLSDRPVHTFSIGFPVPEFDERAYAREAAQLLGTQHHEYVVEPSALESLPRLIWHYDEPFSDSSAIPTMALCEVTRREVTVALSGDGGDELFGGYPRYQAVRMAARLDRLPGPVKSMLAWKVWQKIPASPRQGTFGRRLKRFIAAMGQSPERRYLRWIDIFNTEMRERLYSSGMRSQLAGFDSAEFLLQAYEACHNRDFVTRTTCADVLSYLPCDILTKVDIASMACSLETRNPFLDHHVVELAARMPLELKLTPGQAKKILIETFSDLLPASIQTRRKMGFGVPIDHWFRNELQGLVRDTLLSDRARQRGYFEEGVVRQLIDDHTSGVADHSNRLWTLLVLESWHRVYIDQPPPLSAAGLRL